MEEDYKTDRGPPPPYPTPMTPTPRPPPSGIRIPLQLNSRIPDLRSTRAPPCYDGDGVSPVFIGSAIFQSSVHPCKIAPHLPFPCRVPYAGTEVEHQGRYDLLPFDPDAMEWVCTSLGRIPQGRYPVAGGYEEDGTNLYHARARVGQTWVPGKTGEHLGGCNVAYGGQEHVVSTSYEILCWRSATHLGKDK
ncbi:uncharacterized protein EDB91DRAFT_1198784 [Suillus paluster]|uniref:uncharacterized protein n=1 Tax=Suillus paluster TaxID=48578 RepID=UPI001B881803|nr:uncharacterized protein EDB91DRAFT_796793 [Suillus paluster]XP_041180207.1 uncharacterized protein EDB91DRAFT_1198784 [Suillus paluster]KAG1717631.1 hypothetical protein EDB91DRAFT_796793 [Suillus paluster]KAG1747204.1 hypothetical protein EDB91DRAFT_1198784 [Suillus paluster]